MLPHSMRSIWSSCGPEGTYRAPTITVAARSIWKGVLKIGSSKLPVKLYAAVQDQTVHFHVLEKRSKSRIRQHMVNPENGEDVPKQEIRKGYEVEKGTFVLLNDDEISR